jgi:hypothetical protein
MESVGDRTIKLSGLPLFPQALEIVSVDDFTHSHRTTTTHYDDRTALQKQRRYRFAAT